MTGLWQFNLKPLSNFSKKSLLWLIFWKRNRDRHCNLYTSTAHTEAKLREQDHLQALVNQIKLDRRMIMIQRVRQKDNFGNFRLLKTIPRQGTPQITVQFQISLSYPNPRNRSSLMSQQLSQHKHCQTIS